MTYRKHQVDVTLPSNFAYQDKAGQMLWALINDALRRGEDVTARITAVNTALDQHTLAQRGKDDQGMPVFGVGAGTRVALKLQMTIDVNMPTPDATAAAESPEKDGVPQGQEG